MSPLRVSQRLRKRPRRLPLQLPPNFRDVRAERAGTVTVIVGGHVTLIYGLRLPSMAFVVT